MAPRTDRANRVIGKDLHSCNLDDENAHSDFLEPLNLDDTRVSQIGRFTGTLVNDIEAFRILVPYYSFFEGLYFRAMTSMKSGDKKGIKLFRRNARTENGAEGELGREMTNVQDGSDSNTRGKLPFLGKPSLSEMIYQWRIFAKLIEEDEDLDVQEAQFSLKNSNMGLFQVWGFWRYFSGKELDVRELLSDFKEAFPMELSDDEIYQTILSLSEGEREHLATFQGTISREGFLNHPRRSLCCNYPLGCTQNIPFDSARKANLLSWEIEHSRPQSKGGGERDLVSMCVHHNNMKSDNAIWDVDTLLNIITMGHYIEEEE